VVSASSLHPDEAFRFVAFLVDYDRQAQLALRAVQPPALMAVYEDDALLAQAPVLADVYAGLLTTRPRPQSPDYAGISETIYTEVNDMLRGEQGPEETARAVDQALESLAGKKR